MTEFLQFVFSGLTVGAIYALVAIGFTLIYNASDVVAKIKTRAATR
jgi:branched-chain amino acid transport system permease protein